MAVRKAASDKVAQVTSHANLAQLLSQAGSPEQALMQLGDAELSSIADPKLRADYLWGKGAAFTTVSDFEQATVAYRQCLAILKTLDDETSEAEVSTSIGWAYQSLGDIPGALSNYKDALTLFTKLGDKDAIVRTRLAIGSLYQSIGESEKAIEQYQRVPTPVAKDQYARILVSMAQIDQSRGRTRNALARYQNALSLTETFGDPMLQGDILIGMARCHMWLGLYVEARDDLSRAGNKMKDAGSRAGEAGVLATLGETDYWDVLDSPWIGQKQFFSEALRYYGQALALMREVGDRNGEIGVLANTGLVYDAWQKPGKALAYYLHALQKMEELEASARLEDFRIDLADQAASLYQRAVQLEVNQNHMREAFELSERARARAFLDQIGSGPVNRRLPPDFSAREEKLRRESLLLERQLAQEFAKPGPEIDTAKAQAIQTRLAAVRTEYENSLRDLKISNPEYASFLSISPLTLPDAQKQLGWNVTVISYFTTSQMTLAFVLTRDSFHVTKLPVTEKDLAPAVATFRDFSGENDAPPSLKQLYTWLLAPLKSQLRTPMLAIVPYGAINDLPFAALTDGGHFVGDSYAVFYLPSVSALPYIHPKNNPGGSQILVLANDAEPGLPRLNYANDEARAVASLFGVQPNLGQAATTSNLREHAGDYEIVHLIAHINTDSENPQLSRISTNHEITDDGPLELHQLAGLDLRKTNLVVLSGCQSQMGKRSLGDDVIGLSRAFMYAGSPSVIASLWNVDDEATQQLMVAFYTHLRAGESKAEALRAAQVETRQKYPNPYYWAGFVLSGDPGKVSSSNLLATTQK